MRSKIMAYNRESNFIVNENQIASFLSDALKNVEESTESEIQILNQIKKLFKRNVGFSRRNYVAALLVKQALSNSRSRFGRNDGKNPRGEDRFGRDSRFKNDRAERNSRPSRNDRDARKNEGFDEAAPEREKAPRVQIDPALAGTVFIGIGRNRHVFPRDLVGLLISAAGLERERIGDIRVLANYSFIQLYKEDCEKVIEKLNGYDYRGRKLVVNLSRQKGEDGAPSDQPEANFASAKEMPADDTIPSDVSNEGHSTFGSENSETAKIASAQSEFAAKQTFDYAQQEPVRSFSESKIEETKQFSETTDDGQVKSHFGSGAAY